MPKSSFKKYFEKGTAAIKDTVICLNSSNKVWADLPIKLIKGSEKGPTFTILAGTGGIEYPATSALLQLSKEIDPKELKGTSLLFL